MLCLTPLTLFQLSQTMLGDNPEKTRNPLKKAMRRRTAKTVQFAAPTYVEASDYDYSTEDEDAMVEPFSSTTEPQQQEQTTDRGPPAEVEERNAPEEANVHATRRHSGDSIGGGKASFDSASGKGSIDSKRSSTDDPQLSPRLVDRSGMLSKPNKLQSANANVNIQRLHLSNRGRAPLAMLTLSSKTTA